MIGTDSIEIILVKATDEDTSMLAVVQLGFDGAGIAGSGIGAVALDIARRGRVFSTAQWLH